MRKLIFIAALMYSLKLCANPVMLPPLISEFYYNGGDWQIEVFFAEEYQGFMFDFSELALISNGDTAYFVDGLTIEWNSIMVINQNAMSSAFFIDPTVDWIYFSTLGFDPVAEGIRYGIANPFYLTYSVTSPKPGESVVNQHFHSVSGDDFYLPMKDNSPSIWSDPFECNSRGSFSGYVFDQNNNPVEGVKLSYCQENFCYGSVFPAYSCIETDENGYFETEDLFCNWHIFKLQMDDYVFMTDTLFIEPDSVYYKEYTLTNVGVSDIEKTQDISIFAAPNPLSHKTSFHISTADAFLMINAQILIRDMNGRLVDQIPITASPWAENNVRIDWVPENAGQSILPGLYFYTLEIDGKHISSHKIIISN